MAFEDLLGIPSYAYLQLPKSGQQEMLQQLVGAHIVASMYTIPHCGIGIGGVARTDAATELIN